MIPLDPFTADVAILLKKKKKGGPMWVMARI
jgi:hypothetical protein